MFFSLLQSLFAAQLRKNSCFHNSHRKVAATRAQPHHLNVLSKAITVLDNNLTA